MTILRPALARLRWMTLPLIGVLLLDALAAAGERWCALEVRVTTESGAPLPMDARVLVRGSGFVSTGPLDRSGTANFQEIPAGTYEVQVLGKGIAAYSSSSFDVRPGHDNVLDVVVRLAKAPSASGTISAAELAIPAKVMKELVKASRLIEAGDFKQAEEHCRKAIALYPAFPDAYNALGVIAGRQGVHDEARRQFLKAVEIDPQHAEANANLARMALVDQDWAEAERRAQRSAQSDPSDPTPFMLLTVAQFKLGKLDDAIASAQRAHALAPARYAIVHFIAATALRMEQRTAEAIAEYQTFLSEAPDEKAAPQARAALARLQGR
jgi:Flp pilus assembly protein TadD